MSNIKMLSNLNMGAKKRSSHKFDQKSGIGSGFDRAGEHNRRAGGQVEA
jgi:hypothetical protein